MCSLTDIFTNIVLIETNSACLDKPYTCGSGREMPSLNLPTTGFLAMLFIMLPNNRITLTGNTGKQSKYTKYSGSDK